jgi:hypothetical protein
MTHARWITVEPGRRPITRRYGRANRWADACLDLAIEVLGTLALSGVFLAGLYVTYTIVSR